LVVAFEGDLEGAENLLKAIKEDILAERVSQGRVEYLGAAIVTGLAGAVLIAIITWVISFEGVALDLWRAAVAGAFGAFFSISIGLRGRTVLPDLERTANIMDAVLRVSIGLMGAAVLMGLIRADIVNVAFGEEGTGRRLAGDLDWLQVLIAGFVAGFSERFVPDLLAKTTVNLNVQSRVVERTRTTEIRTEAPPAPPPPGTPVAAEEHEEGEDPLPEEAATDACVSDIDLPDEDATHDRNLPAAAGGVATSPDRGGN
jgi:hypothetical protein